MGTVTVTKLCKAYKQYPNRWARLAEWLTPGHRSRHSLIWVLRDISFTVQQGEAVGIIGINGAGKSTLMKMITGTTHPTTGSVHICGSVAALLEMGMGFHPDFTGRQNAFMAGQLLGYSVEEIARLMPDIEAFAEIGDYIDQPVRVYSNGMQVRLAFSVATAHRPDVLIVDEALSVGDAYFQHKSFERIRDYSRRGTTLLIVSHDKSAIQSICDRAILLNAGQLAMQGKPEAVMDYYNALLADHQNQSVKQEVTGDGHVQTISGTGLARIVQIKLLDEDDKPIEVASVGRQVTLQVTAVPSAPIPKLVLGFMIKDRLGLPIYGTNTDLKGMPLIDVKVGKEYSFRFSFPMNLGPGSYSVAVALTGADTHLINNYEWRDQALVFSVVNVGREHFAGCVWLNPSLSIES